IANVLRDLEEEWIEMPNNWLRHYFINARVNLSGTGAEEESLGRVERRRGLHRVVHAHQNVSENRLDLTGALGESTPPQLTPGVYSKLLKTKRLSTRYLARSSKQGI